MDLGLCGRISLPLCTQRSQCCVWRDLWHFALFRHGKYDWRFTGWMPGHEYLLTTLPCDGASLGGAMRLSQHFHHAFSQGDLFGQPDAPMEKVIEAAKKACCHDFIMALPDGYETIIGEGGANLSGGEKQRISIARAIMKDAPIVILDEATANVDPESEQELTNAIEALTKEKTIIMIAHRLKTVRHADNILVIDGGKIVQSGTHEQLMQQGGIYRRFVESRELAVGWKV